MLRGNHGVNVMLDGLLQEKSLRLSVFFRDRNKLFIELCVDCGTDFTVVRLAKLHLSKYHSTAAVDHVKTN